MVFLLPLGLSSIKTVCYECTIIEKQKKADTPCWNYCVRHRVINEAHEHLTAKDFLVYKYEYVAKFNYPHLADE